jgi:hypothetical protein
MGQMRTLAIALTLAWIAIATTNSTAQLFKTAQTFAVSRDADYFAVGDFNGDGNPDIILINNFSSGGRAQVYLGNGKGGFSKGSTPEISAFSLCVVVGDFNNDGKLDLAVGGENTLDILLGKGDGTFQAPMIIEQQSPVFSIAAADLNNDGKLDLILSSATVLLGNGNGTFQGPINTGAIGSTVPIVVGDFTGDKKLDLAMLDNRNQQSLGYVMVYPGNGDGTFQPAIVTVFPGYNSSGITAADFNRDGKLDLAISGCSDINCFAPETATILLGNGDGTFQSQTVTATLGIGPMSILSADFNRDGIPDLLELNRGSADITIWTGKGDGTFNSSESWAMPLASHLAVVGDFNNDGQPDIVILDLNVPSEGLTFVKGLPGAKFAAALESYAPAPDVPATGDFNEDGKLDVIVGNGFASSVSVALGQGDGTFQSLPSFSFPANSGPSQILVGDFNGDHHLDMIYVTAFADGQTFIALGNGDGTFKPAVPIHCGDRSFYLEIGDFNGDGILDIVASNDVVPAALEVCLGNGDGTFQPPVPFLTNDYYVDYLAVADVNGDGKLDLILVVGNNPGSVQTMLGNGDGTFQPPSPPTTLGRYPLKPVLVDLNGDGNLDMVVQMNDSTDNLYVLFGDGKGNFHTSQIFSLPKGPASVAGTVVVADFNGDGILDIADPYADIEAGIGMLFGKGNGTFTKGSPINVVPFSIVGGDFNGDGKTDLVFSSPYNSALTTLLNTPPK